MWQTSLLARKRQAFVSLQEAPVLTMGTCGQWMVDRDFRFVRLDMTGIKMLHWLSIGEMSPFALFWIARANTHQMPGHLTSSLRISISRNGYAGSML